MKWVKRVVTEIMPLMKTFEFASALFPCKCKIISQIQRNKINRAYTVGDVLIGRDPVFEKCFTLI